MPMTGIWTGHAGKLKTIEYTKYEDDLEDDGVENILKYGIACYKKRCKVMLAEK